MRHLAVILLSCCILCADPAYVNCVAADSGGTAKTTVNTAATSMTAGNLSFVFIHWRNSCSTTTATITNTAGDTYTQIGGYQNNSAAGTCSARFYNSNSAGHASNVYTVTLSASVQNPSISVLQTSGLRTTSVLDASVSSAITTAGTTITSPSFSTTQASELMVAGGSSYNTGGTWTADTGWTKPSSCDGPNKWSTIQYQVVSSTQSNITTTLTRSITAYLAIGVATFKAPAAAASSPIRHRVIQ